MAVGVIFANKPITGSCGGMSALGMEVACDVCGGDKDKCDKEVDSAAKDAAGKDISYNAMK
ncbi:ApbE family protein [Oleiphilus sp. HI0069]|nr:ApbE family protein [Oleiphilus sp. HI0069]